MYVGTMTCGLKIDVAPFHSKLCTGLAEALDIFRNPNTLPKTEHPVWLAFALQAYVEIHVTLGSTITRGFDELRAASKRNLEQSSKFGIRHA